MRLLRGHRKLLERVTEAEYAIYQRLHSLEGTLNCESRLYRSLDLTEPLSGLVS
jgi:hypothetical protein